MRQFSRTREKSHTNCDCFILISEEDGCILDFENTAMFSREYQESQECMCDSEHMFDCGRSNAGTKHSVDVEDLVRKLQVIFRLMILLQIKLNIQFI